MDNLCSYFEIPVTNLDRAVAFYQSVFGIELSRDIIHRNEMAFFPVNKNELFDLSKPFRHLVDKLKEIPGFSDVLAIGVIAEAADQMDHFKDERKFAAWADVASGNNESAGKKKDQNAGKAILT